MTKKRKHSTLTPDVKFTGTGRDERAGRTYRRYECKDAKGVTRTILYATEKGKDRGSELIYRIEHQGLCKTPLAPGATNRFINALDAQECDREFVVTSQVGWVGDEIDPKTAAFCTPIKMYKSADQDIERDFQGVATSHKFKMRGTLSDWQNHVAALGHLNPLLIFMISAGFAGPLLKLLDVENGGFQIVGKSSTGKTSYLMAAGSIWGSGEKGFLEKWLMSENAIDDHALTYSDTLLALDETGLAPRAVKQLLDTAYRLWSGEVKARQTDTARRRTYRALFLSTSEHTLAAMARDANVQWSDGQLIRMIDIDSNGGKDMGVFQNIHGEASPGVFSNRLTSAAKMYYGTAGDAFLTELLRAIWADVDGWREWLRKRMAYYRKHAPDVGLRAFNERVCTRFELVYAAGMLAVKFGILPYSKREVLEAVQYAHHKGMFDALAATSTPRVSGVQLVKAFIETNKDSFIDVAHAEKYDQNILENPKGYRRKLRTSTYFLFLPRQFERDVCACLSYASVISDLRSEGLLQSYRGGNTMTIKLPGHSKKKRVICISSRIINTSE